MIPAPSPWALLALWLSIPLTQIWLHLSCATPPALGGLILEAILFAWLGLVLPRLDRWPTLSHPVWIALVPLGSLALEATPRSLAGLPYLAGLWLGGIVPIRALLGRIRLPWWAYLPVIPLLVIGAHIVRSLGSDRSNEEAVIDRLSRDLRGPLVWASPLPRPAAGDQRPPVVVISVDTLRAEDARQMETWARLSARGAWWRSAQSTSSWTLPATDSLLTGLPSSGHGAGCLDTGSCQGLADEVQTLPVALSHEGYPTVGIVTNPWIGRRNGFERGFHRFLDLGTDRPVELLLTGSALLGPHPQDAEVGVGLALDALRSLGPGPFLLWLHLIDPHLPYLHADDPALRSLTAETLRNANLVSAERRDQIRSAYRGEIAYTDHQLLRLLDALEARGFFERGYLVFTSDHGEEFWEHGGIEHGHTHHPEVVEVPLVVVGPDVEAGARPGTASLVDVVTTLAAALRLPLETAGLDLRQPIPPDRIARLEGNLIHRAVCSAVDAELRVIVSDCGAPYAQTSAYDRRLDPGALRPQDRPDHPVWRAAQAIEAPSPRGQTWQARDALRALGYVD